MGGEPATDDPRPPPQPTTDVRVTVRDATTVRAGVTVLFQAPDDSLVAETVTDASGSATAKMPNGGSVTVIRTYEAADQIYTYAGVKPGDVLELVNEIHDDAAYNTKITVGLANGELVHVRTPCGEAYGYVPVIDVSLRGCGNETDFFITSYSLDDGPLYFATHAVLAPEIDLSGEVLRGTLTTEITASNTPAMSVTLQKRLVLGGFTVFDSGYTGAPTVTIDVPELPDSDQIVSAHVTTNDGAALVVSAREQFTSAPATIDVASNLIPASHTPALGGSTLSWLETGTGSPDLSLATIEVEAIDRRFVRTIAAPYSATRTMLVPVLPGAAAKYNVQPSDTPALSHALARVSGGYDAARARIFNRTLADLAPDGGTATIAYPSKSTP